MLINKPTLTLPAVFEEKYGGRTLRKVAMADVTHFRAGDKYVYACHKGDDVMLHSNLKSLVLIEEALGADWLRVHRATLVRRSCIKSGRRVGDRFEITLHGSDTRLTVSRREVRAVREMLAAGQGAQAA